MSPDPPILLSVMIGDGAQARGQVTLDLPGKVELRLVSGEVRPAATELTT